MDDRTLQQFVNLAASLHFGRASEASHVSPSALSRSIRRLEERVGARLFERNNRMVELTAAGERFLDYARQALGDWDSIRNTLMEQSGELVGDVRIYCSVTASYSFLYDILARFRANHPRVEIRLHTGDPEDAIPRVLAGEEDMAIGARPDRLPPGLAFRLIAESPLVFIGSKPGPGSPGRRLALDQPMIVPERGLARRRIDDWFAEHGARPNVYAQVAGNEAIVSMVALGFGVGVVPRIVLDNSPLADRVELVDFEPALGAYPVGLFALERKLASPIMSAFWN
jgi:LysR family positive regulator for ilvC